MKRRVDAGPLAARLIVRGAVLGAAAVEAAALRLADQPLPPGISAEPLPDGVRLSGRCLALRIARDPAIGRIER